MDPEEQDRPNNVDITVLLAAVLLMAWGIWKVIEAVIC